MADKPGATLLFDSAKCHLTEKVNRMLDDLGINKEIIAPRFTNLLQPADVSWFAKIKQQLHEKWNSWYVSEDNHSFKAIFGHLGTLNVFNG